MDFVLAMAAFVGGVLLCLIRDLPMLYGLLLGYTGFLLMGKRRGFTLTQLMRASWEGVKESLIVVRILALIGFLTAAWRMNGTIAYCTYYGASLVPPRLFLLAAFMLTAAISYSIGTSLGVASTVGVIFMGIARSGGVPELLAAGAILSGVYFGDRTSPVSSTANLVSALTGTELYANVKRMLKSSVIPVVICCLVYGVLSWQFPLGKQNSALLQGIALDFTLSPWLLLPVGLMLLLPILKVNVKIAMTVSILMAVIQTFWIQKAPVADSFLALLTGFAPQGMQTGTLFCGGGLSSMLNVMGILMLSGTFSKIFRLTGCLKPVEDWLRKLYGSWGLFPVTALLSLLLAMVFCSQVVATMMLHTLAYEHYAERDAQGEEMALDLSNSVVVMASMVPWSLSVAVPMEVMGVGAGVIPWIIFVYMLPLVYFLMKNPAFFKSKLKR